MSSRTGNSPEACGGVRGEQERAEFIVQGPEVATEVFRAVVANNPMIEVVQTVASDVLVLNMTEAEKQALLSRFLGLTIEPNEELRRL